ncbi:MAG: diaminopimelate decarboxylase, partial [Armatimonadota bacterium]
MLAFGTQTINARGHLEVGGCDCVELAREYGTPLYVLDEALIRENCRRYRRVFEAAYPPGVNVAYAGKALLTQAICKLMAQEGMWLDVASGGELHTALVADFPPEHIYFHGNYKSAAELEMALDGGVGEIVIDSLAEIEALEALAGGRAQTAAVAIRVAPGIKVHTHTYIQTGQVDSKFGLGVEGSLAMRGLRRAAGSGHLDLRGVHCHIGSQIFSLESYERTVEIMLDLMAEAQAEGIRLRELNLGGGLGIRHTHEDAPVPLGHFANTICTALSRGLEERKLDPPTLVLEPGRSIVGEAGLTLYTIGVVKEIPGVRTYVSVDGGLSDNPRPGLYQAEYEAVVANKA